MLDRNNLSPREMAAAGADEPTCGDCRRSADWCECIKCSWCEETIREDDAREVMPDGKLVHTDHCHGDATGVAQRQERRDIEESRGDYQREMVRS